jgi:hypothetical protein
VTLIENLNKPLSRQVEPFPPHSLEEIENNSSPSPIIKIAEKGIGACCTEEDLL